MSQTLPTELDTLVYRGLLLPAEEDDPLEFLRELAECTARGEVTEAQAAALCDMLGVRGN
jgi:hypothetical protein